MALLWPKKEIFSMRVETVAINKMRLANLVRTTSSIQASDIPLLIF